MAIHAIGDFHECLVIRRIKMTAPVITQNNYMAFVMPSIYDRETVPMPVNPKVKIKVQPERYLAVLRFGGYSTKNKKD